MKTCDICFNDCEERFPRSGQMVCKECRKWIDYWLGLTPEGQRKELQMMDEHQAWAHG